MLDPGVVHAAEFRRCLIDLDVVGIRRLWRHVASHLPQPVNDDDALYALHLARTKVPTLPIALQIYSKQWLEERRIGQVMITVGIAVGAPISRRNQAINIREAMSDAVASAIKAGVDLATEPDEIKRRMMIARNKA